MNWWQVIVVCAAIFVSADGIEKAIRDTVKR